MKNPYPIQLLFPSHWADYGKIDAESTEEAMRLAWKEYPEAKGIRVVRSLTNPNGYYELWNIGAKEVGLI